MPAFHYVDSEVLAPIPDSLTYVNRAIENVDTWHNFESDRLVWVNTIHSFERYKKMGKIGPNSVFVSGSLAQYSGYDRYVYNSLDPAQFIYSEEKEDYFLFIASLGRGNEGVSKRA